MMRPSVWTSYLEEWDPYGMVRRFSEHGWQTLELSDEHGHDLLKIGPPLKVGESFRKFAADYGISFPQGHFYLQTEGVRPNDLKGRKVADIAPADGREFLQAMEDMRRWIDLFNNLGVRAGALHLGGCALEREGWCEERIFARRVEALSRVAEYAEGGPTLICLENMGSGSGVRTIAEMVRVITAVDQDNIAICLDTGHANLAGISSTEFIGEAGSRLKALHIADNFGKDDDHILPYGRGTVPWKEVMRALRAINYEGLFNFEVPGESRCPEPVRMAKLDYALRLGKWMIEFDGI